MGLKIFAVEQIIPIDVLGNPGPGRHLIYKKYFISLNSEYISNKQKPSHIK